MIYPLWGKQVYGYLPRGPQDCRSEHVEKLLKEITELQKTHALVFLRCDPVAPLPNTASVPTYQAFSPQPEATLTLDLTLSEEELLKQMKRKGRYNINLAEKKGVQIKDGSLDDFMQLLKQTTSRDGFSGHDKKYYETMLKTIPGARLYSATKDQKTLASALVIHYEDTAIYYYGASSNEDRELMAPYLVQWHAITTAKAAGLGSYDFLGIAPDKAAKNHPWAGVTEFKKKFGGKVISYPQPTDMVFSRTQYMVYRLLKFFQKRLR